MISFINVYKDIIKMVKMILKLITFDKPVLPLIKMYTAKDLLITNKKVFHSFGHF